MNCRIHLDAFSSPALQRYRITRWKRILGTISSLIVVALSANIFIFAPNAIPIPPDTTLGALSAAGTFRDSTNPRALCPKDATSTFGFFCSNLLGPLPFKLHIIFHTLSKKLHQSSLTLSPSENLQALQSKLLH
uniref:Uncharacterized protein n=1 Tax=Arundo donax TaxID=35708 RepID=A0A0A8ZT19_ARUDO